MFVTSTVRAFECFIFYIFELSFCNFFLFNHSFFSVGYVCLCNLARLTENILTTVAILFLWKNILKRENAMSNIYFCLFVLILGLRVRLRMK